MQSENNRPCPVCGNDLGDKKTFCSWSCYRSAGVGNSKARTIPYQDRDCGVCGKTFQTQIGAAINDRQYCSQECSGRAHKKIWPEIDCQQCGKRVAVVPNRRDKARFCSQSCAAAAHSESADAKRNVHTCITCGKTYKLSDAISANNKGFCSRRCHYASRATVCIPAVCIVCRGNFTARREQAKFCSAGCWAIEKRRSQGKATAINTTGRCLECDTVLPAGAKRTQRYCESCKNKRRKQHYKYTCRKCGKHFTCAEKRRIYCSDKCKGRTFSKRREYECEICEKKFTAAGSRKRVRFCSVACCVRSRTVKPADHVCEWCQVAFKRKPHRGPARFCSRTCLGHFGRSRASWGADKRTSIEVATAKVLDKIGIRYTEQVSIGPWIVDFLVEDRNVVIECDGTYWHSMPRAKARDNSKDAYLRRMGYAIVRLPERDIKQGKFSALKTALK